MSDLVIRSVATPKGYRLKPNPFESFRDPDTGKWQVVFKLPISKARNNMIEKPAASKSLLAQTLSVRTLN